MSGDLYIPDDNELVYTEADLTAHIALFAQKAAALACDGCRNGWEYNAKSGRHKKPWPQAPAFVYIKCHAEGILGLADPNALAEHDAALDARIRELETFAETSKLLDKKARHTTSLAIELAKACLLSFSLQVSENPLAVRLRDICYTILGAKHNAQPNEVLRNLEKLEADNAALREVAREFLERHSWRDLCYCSVCKQARALLGEKT